MKSQKMRVLPCASTGIAAELLIDGGTVHRRFSVPNDVNKDDAPRVPRHSNYAAVLDAAQLIIIDEISMQDRYVLEYVDRQLRDISAKYHHLPFAGKTIVIGGDWKQLMPVIPGGNSEVQCSRSVKNSRLFRCIQSLLKIPLYKYIFLVFSKQQGSQ
jgi:ATP-dependent DNA helicase PIF1